MKLWVDDERLPPNGWTWAKTYKEAIDFLNMGEVEVLSLDHDLGLGKTGYDVAKWIEDMASHGGMERLIWKIHSANPVGRANITAAMNSAERFWQADADMDKEANEEVFRGGREEWK